VHVANIGRPALALLRGGYGGSWPLLSETPGDRVGSSPISWGGGGGMKGIAWVQAQDDALRAGWCNPRVSGQDIAIALGVTHAAVHHRARKLGLGRIEYSPEAPRLFKIDGKVAVVWTPGDGGHLIKIDRSDLDWFLTYPGGWYAHAEHGGHYVYSREKPHQKLHRLLLDATPSQLVDHENRNGLDNTRSNLRLVTPAQNCHNSGPRRRARSAYKGVWLHRPTGLFGGCVKGPDGHRHSIGYYRTEEEAARAHDALAKMFRHEYAFLNLPEHQLSDDDIMRHPSLRRAYVRVMRHRLQDAA